MVVTLLDEQSKSENYESFAMSNKNENVSRSFVDIFVLSLAENSVRCLQTTKIYNDASISVCFLLKLLNA